MPNMNEAKPGLLAQEHPAHVHSHDLEARIAKLEAMVFPMFADYAKTYDSHNRPLEPRLPAVQETA